MTANATWWDRNISEGASMDQFKAWVEGHTAVSKVAARRMVEARGYGSILDCGAGLCSEHEGYRQDRYTICYHALDATAKFVKLAQDRGIAATLGSVEKIPFEDRAFDVVYCRHVLEHLADYRAALAEMVRVASKEAIVVWFIPPHEDKRPDEIKVMDGDLYHNSYDRDDLNEYIRGLSGVASHTWTPVGERETILRITREE